MRRKYKPQSPAQRRATIRNQHKGRVAMMNGLIDWMLKYGSDSLSGEERKQLSRCGNRLKRIFKEWQPTL